MAEHAERSRRGARDDAVRTFVGLALGEAARARASRCAAELAASTGGDDLRWVAPEALHVTLRFLGTTPRERLPELAHALGPAVGAEAPFTVALGGVNAFPTLRRPRVLVLDVVPAAPVAALAAAVERAVVSAGFPGEERPFRPHVTLGRVRRGRRPRLVLPAPQSRESPPGVTASVTEADDAWEVMDTVLFRSDTSRAGARYTPLERFPLGTGNASGSLHP